MSNSNDLEDRTKNVEIRIEYYNSSLKDFKKFLGIVRLFLVFSILIFILELVFRLSGKVEFPLRMQISFSFLVVTSLVCNLILDKKIRKFEDNIQILKSKLKDF